MTLDEIVQSAWKILETGSGFSHDIETRVNQDSRDSATGFNQESLVLFHSNFDA